ncbi:Lsr2 dimerization domain-containing protein [Nocardioides soli]|uniref:Lsr2 family protein n=1 Tax=Nocardioides soli TaxID=1036020 RepID=A0A7W4W0A0_9ACTN|nr:hypothetical protein [Nocardioides soli]
MAQKVVTQMVSDLSGDEYADGKGETIVFSYRGKDYSIDLTSKEAAGFDKAVAMYVEHATKVTGTPGRRKAAKPSGPSAADVRQWGKENGFDLPDRGRVPAEVREAYDAAH